MSFLINPFAFGGGGGTTPPASPHTETFSYTGAQQSYTVLAGETEIFVRLWASGGGAGNYLDQTGSFSGAGAVVEGVIDVVEGDVIAIDVPQGGRAYTPSTSGGAGGWPDGGGGARGDVLCGGGGGSARLYKNGTLYMVAGAGGGSAYPPNGSAGGGGFPRGQDASNSNGGRGGTQTSAGFDGSDSGNVNKQGRWVVDFPGAQRTGGWGGSTGDTTTSTTDDGAGGGGGYYGGGGGGGDGLSGGGGSSWFHSSVRRPRWVNPNRQTQGQPLGVAPAGTAAGVNSGAQNNGGDGFSELHVNPQGTTPAGFSAALVGRLTDTALGASAQDVPFDIELLDEDDYADTNSAPTLLTTPSAGLYRATACVAYTSSGYTDHAIYLNGAAFAGGGGNVLGGRREALNSGIVSCGAGDDFSLRHLSAIAATYGEGASLTTWLAVEKLDDAAQYARLALSSGQALAAGTPTALSFGTASADVGGWYSAGAPTRLTVPVGVTCVRLVGGLVTTSFTGRAYAAVRKNGTDNVIGLPRKSRGPSASGARALSFIGAPVEVSAGDYFEMFVELASAATVVVDGRTFFEIEEVPASIKRALVYHSTGHAATTALAAMACNAEAYDTDGLHDNATNNSRLTVPSGCTRARASFSVLGTSAGVALEAVVYRNGSPCLGLPWDYPSHGGQNAPSGGGAWIEVEAGDYFELMVRSGSNQTLSAASWFCLECR